MTPGWKTSEFWIALCGLLSCLVMALGIGEHGATVAGTIGAGVIAVVYTWARTKLKTADRSPLDLGSITRALGGASFAPPPADPPSASPPDLFRKVDR
jgi:O-antigen/teichoic acid export membrane protein